ncbi:MAG TPA: hypothetical protein PKL31_05930 [Fulvivirga sp.]|nr:hypothetical protein [Fulvivirga sp.]
MREGYLVLGLGIISSSLSFAQVKKQFSIDNVQTVERVDLDFAVNSGSCVIKPGQTDEILTVYGNQNYDSYSHSFNKETIGNTCKVNLVLEDDKSSGLSSSISYRMFGKSEAVSDKIWKLFLSEDKTYDLNLKYGIGKADIDLSGLAVEKIKISTGSADINVGYLTGTYNRVPMDTFYVKVDLGSIKVQNLNLSKSKHVIADIGFGDLLLDFSNKSEVSSNIRGSVGAGNLVIVLPHDNTPVIVKINNSWLCNVKMTKSLKNIGDNTFVNSTYTADADNLLSFTLDVSMGNIIFKDGSSSSK